MKNWIIAMSAATMVAACDEREPNAPTNMVVENVAPISAGTEEPEGCAAAWTITVDRPSFALDGKPADADRLAAFEASVAPAVRNAVNEACAAGEIDAKDAKAIRTLSIANDADRDTPKFYADESDRTRTVLADAFVARDFAIASEMELRGGMQCLTTMSSKTCEESIQ